MGERLGEWLGWTEAAALSDALHANRAVVPADGSADPASSAAGVAADLAQVRNGLTRAIHNEALFLPARPGLQLTGQAAGNPGEGKPDFLPYRRCYLAHQRKMDAGIAPLRARLRTALSSRGAVPARLAAIDAVLDQALLGRERHLLSKLAPLLERHFDRLRPIEPAQLASFGKDMQTALLAELELRLQPVDALLQVISTLPTTDTDRGRWP